MAEVQISTASNRARVLVVSQRGLHRVPPRCVNYEFEDCIASFDDADVATVAGSRAISRWQRRWARVRGLSGGDRSPIVDRRYEMLFVCCQSTADLLALGPIERWTACAQMSVCWVDELWAASLERRPHELNQLRRFDQIVIGCHGSVDALSTLVDRPVMYLPAGIDAQRFCPYPNPPGRTIDVYAMGRRSPTTHEALLSFADQTGRFYFYDTLHGVVVRDAEEHRRLLANVLQRTKYFLAYRAKVNAPDQTNTQEEIGFRFFEGAAAGAVMLGESPRHPMFASLFDWPDAVIHLPFGSENAGALIESLDDDPERIERAGRNNVLGVLRKHDWAHRWRHILEQCDLAPSQRTNDRCDRLLQTAQLIQSANRAAA